jgi:hypothetical protein
MLMSHVRRQEKDFALEVVDLAKDPLAAGPLARSTTRHSILANALDQQSARRLFVYFEVPTSVRFSS